MRVPQKIALTGALLAAGAGLGLALPAVAQDAGGSTTTTEQPAEAPSADERAAHEAEHAERRAEHDADLAEQLGVSVDELTAAREAAREAVDAQLGEPERPEQRPESDEERDALRAQMEERHAAFESALASELGIGVDELRAAHAALAEEHLAEAVAEGRLTQEEADARLEAIRNGEAPLGGPGHHGPGGHGPGGHGPGGRPPVEGD